MILFHVILADIYSPPRDKGSILQIGLNNPKRYFVLSYKYLFT